MSRLEFYARPLVAFDPKNKDHRRWYHEFIKFKGWGRCPVRFICPNDIGYDLTIMIRNELIDYYVNQEFKPVVKKPQTKTVAQKAKKTVDKRVKK
jgi:hypothetical protein